MFWIKAEITDVKKQPERKWCFLKFIEKDGNTVSTEIKGVFWSNSYFTIEKFEKATGQQLANGLEITCGVRVKFHKRFGLNLEVMDIDISFALGKAELERQQTLDRLVRENPTSVLLVDGQFITKNKRTLLPSVLQRIALITAPESDGQRDFIQELTHNTFGYAFKVTEFLTRIQGDTAADMIRCQLQLVEANASKFDVVAIVRGGGSQTDFKPFDDYELARYVACFPIPIFTGIGHDRNTSITDLMARQYKTPTKVAATIVDHNFSFESDIANLKTRLGNKVNSRLERLRNNLDHLKRTLKAYSPATIMNKGYAVVLVGDEIVTDPSKISSGAEIKTILGAGAIYSNVQKVTNNDYDL